MTLDETMARLEVAGSEQTRKTYRRHGIMGPLFGVSCAAQKPITKAIGRDHALAKALWATGNYDARVLATTVADPKRVTDDELDEWVSVLDNYGLTDAVAAMAAQTGRTRALADRYRDEPGEYAGALGWQLVGRLAEEPGATEDAYFLDRLRDIEGRIHTAPNRVRYSMNMAVILIGLRNETLRGEAVATAMRIGKVHVDHGDTSCKTPDAVAYIEKALAHRERQKQKS